VQQQGWVVVVRLDRTTTKVDIPELDFRFDVAKYEGANSLPPDPRVNDFVAVSLANSRLLSVAREEVTLAKSRVMEAQRALGPALTARVSSTRGKEVNPFPKDDFEGFEATTFKREEYGVQATQPIYQSGRLYNALRQTKINRAMALENVRKQAQDLTYEVKKAYFTLLKNQTIHRVRRELVAQGQAITELVKKKKDLQLASKAEVLNVSAQADQAAYQLVSDEQDISLARLVLISLTNQSEPLPDPVPGALSFGRLSFNVESIISWAQEHRPDVRIARLNSELARLNWKAQKADNDIKLDASGFYGRAGAAFAEDDFNMREAWNVGLKVSRVFWGNTVRGNFSKERTAPDLGQSFLTDSQQKTLEVGLWDALPGSSNARQAELQFEKAKAELVEASRKAEYEVRESYYNLEKAARQLEAVRQDLTFKQKDLEITREKVKLGLSELSQLMAAEVAYSLALVSEQEALSAYNISLAAMDRVAGAEVVRE
jgi:outer membrane protein